MASTKKTKLVSWEDHLDKKYGKSGTLKREKYEEAFDTFKIGILIQEARIKQNMTQQELASKVGTTKNYISRVENNANDMRLSTLMRIVREGLGGQLIFDVKLRDREHAGINPSPKKQGSRA